MRTAHLILVRHGHTSANGGGTVMRLSGWTDVPLSALGHREAALLGRRLAGEEITAVYTSPLHRARTTAGYLTRGHGRLLVLSPDLREIGCGAADGKTIDAAVAEFPDAWERNERQDDDDFRWPGGESYREFRARCHRAMCAIAARHPGERVAVVTHAGVITQIAGAMRGCSPAAWRAYRAGNGSITRVEWCEEQGTLLTFDDREHLEPLDRSAATTRRPLAG
jgi:broad specificity phosphatase PhoE